jgi:hypothetical protein
MPSQRALSTAPAAAERGRVDGGRRGLLRAHGAVARVIRDVQARERDGAGAAKKSA